MQPDLKTQIAPFALSALLAVPLCVIILQARDLAFLKGQLRVCQVEARHD